jgi:hypothetical protein
MADEYEYKKLIVYDWDMAKKLEELSREGWEVVQMDSSMFQSTGAHHVLLRRRKSRM